MDQYDPADAEWYSQQSKVCAKCFGDPDLRERVAYYGGPRGCDYCGKRDAPTTLLNEIAEFIKERIGTFYGKAVEQLPYESAEGGYQGWHIDTYDLLYNEIVMDLPRDDDGRLMSDIHDYIGDDAWCEYDWLSLDPDRQLMYSWEDFCNFTKHNRRFFFHGGRKDRTDDREYISPGDLLKAVCDLVDRHGLIKSVPAGFELYRARPRDPRKYHATAAALGPPPPEIATQSNRMNPPGISMFYGAESATLAVSEVRSRTVSVGKFKTIRDIRLLDLVALPPVPGFFSEADRNERLLLSFLHEFAKLIVEPVPRDDRVHVDYVPTQVFTEFLRDFMFEGGLIDGLRYSSATGRRGANVVLFAEPRDVVGAVEAEPWETLEPWLELVSTRQLR